MAQEPSSGEETIDTYFGTFGSGEKVAEPFELFVTTGPTRFDTQTDAKEFEAAHRLACAVLPPHRLRALLRAGDGLPTQALALNDERLRGTGLSLTDKQIARVSEARSAPLPDRWADRTADVVVLFPGDPDYPAGLSPFTDAPGLLFVRGNLQASDGAGIAIVGSRRATNYGRSQAERFARAFAETGLAIVSGGASGIDTAAHRGALGAAARTIAVLGCGVDVVYPAENRALFAEIPRKGGAVVSEFGMGASPEPWRFPARNRIIAGMSRATLMVETPRDSGALITARNARDYGREVFVVPGPVDTGRSQGGHLLIQDGAILADSPQDVLDYLATLPALPGTSAPARSKSATKTESAAPTKATVAPLPTPPATPRPAPPDLPPDQAALLAQLDDEARHLDVAGAKAGLTAAQAGVAATLLEMKNLIRRQPGNLFVRV